MSQIFHHHPIVNDETVQQLLKSDCEGPIVKWLGKLRTMHAEMKPLYEKKDLEAFRFRMHQMLTPSGFLGAEALYHFCRYKIYPPLHEGKWPDLTEDWFGEIEILLDKTFQIFLSDYQLEPEASNFNL